jgi:hypothetical protein
MEWHRNFCKIMSKFFMPNIYYIRMMFEDDMILWLLCAEKRFVRHWRINMGNPTPAKDMLGQE